MVGLEPVEFGPGYWGPIIATGTIGLGIVIAWLLMKGGHRITASKPSADKLKTYACGEVVDPDASHVDSEQFFSPIRRVFKPFYRFVRPAHSGILSTYLFWVMVGLIVIFIAIALVLR